MKVPFIAYSALAASAFVFPAEAGMSADQNNTLLGMLRGVFVHERCTGQTFSEQQAMALDDRIVATVMLQGPSREEVVAAFGPALILAEATTPQHPRASDCRGAKKLIELLSSM